MTSVRALGRMKRRFWPSAARTFPVAREIFKAGACGDTMCGISLFRIIGIAADRADIFAGWLAKGYGSRRNNFGRLIEIDDALGFEIFIAKWGMG